MKLLLITLLFISPAIDARADRFLNLDFELMAYGSTSPMAWETGGNGYSIALDSLIKHHGRYSLVMTGAGKTGNDYASCADVFNLSRVKGKKVTINGYIKTEDISGGNATLWCLVYGKAGKLAYQDIKDGPSGTTGWKQFAITVTVSEEATFVSFGTALTGKGKAWFDDLQVYINDQRYDDNANMPREPTDKELKWLRSTLTPINSLGIDSKDNDLEPIGQIAARAKIVALGEVTHGSSEIYKMKNRIVKHLVEKEGFTVFAIEANMPEAYRINEYILNGKGDPKELIKGMYFWIWDTQEMLDLVNWMKEYNSGHSTKITFTGFDMQYADGAIAEVSSMCNKYGDATIINSLKPLEDSLAAFKQNIKSNAEPSLKQKEFFKNEWAALRSFAINNMMGKEEKQWLLQNIRVLEQYTTDIMHSQRNEFMAENLLWIKKQNPGAKIIVWAHNAHIQKTGTDMGSYIVKELKGDYVTVGFSFHEGSYTAYGKNGITAYPAQSSYPGTYEYYFHNAGVPIFLLDLQNISKSDPASKWLSGNLEFRTTGAMKTNDEFGSFNPVNNFDMLVFIDKSTNSALLHKR